VHVVPLLFETGYGDSLDRSIVVVATDANRIARVMERDHIDEARVRARISAQIAPEKARSLADYVIENDADLAHLQTRTRQVYDLLSS
jgi:dephospho-CoA kinase